MKKREIRDFGFPLTQTVLQGLNKQTVKRQVPRKGLWRIVNSKQKQLEIPFEK